MDRQVFGKFCAAHNLGYERIPVKTLNENAPIESFNSILEDECLTRYELSFLVSLT